MLIQLGVNRSLAQSHSLSHRFPGSIVKWNGSSSSYEVVAEKRSKTHLTAWIVGLGSALYAQNGWTAWKSGDLGMGILCAAIAFASGVFAATSPLFKGNASDCVSFLNGLLSVENNWKEDNVFQEMVRANPFVKLLTQALIISQMLYPLVFSLVACSFPCSPLNMFSSAMAWCHDGDSNTKWLLMRVATGLGTAAPHFVFWKGFMCQAIMDALHVSLASLCQQSLIGFMRGRARRDHRGGFSFDLNLYRSCQLLNIYFSKYCSSVGLAFMGVLMGSEIAFSSLLLKTLDGSSNLPLLIKMMVFVACPTLYLFHMVAVGEAASVNTSSISLLAKVFNQGSNNGQQQSSKLGRRQIRSAWPLKVKLGECNNFIEAATTLVMLDFSLRRLVDLLIIGNNGKL